MANVAVYVDQAKGLADKRGDASVPDADWVTYVNWGQLSLWRRITALDPGAYFAQYDFTLAGGAAAASFDLAGTTLPFRALHGLDLSPDTPQRRSIQRRNFQERNKAAIGWWTPAPWSVDRAYDLRARTLVITPYELAAGSYRVYYRHGPHVFAGAEDATALDFQLEPYDEYVVIMAARKALKIEETETGPWSERLAELIQEITDEHERDDEAPAILADVEGDTDLVTGRW